QPAEEGDRAAITALREVTSLQPARQLPPLVRPSERPWGSGGNRPVRCAVLLGSGVLIGLVAEALLGASPGLCAEEATRIVGLALLGWGATAAAGAAFCLAHGVVPPRPDPASSGATLPGPAPVAVWGGPVLPIGGVLFLLGAAGVSLQ